MNNPKDFYEANGYYIVKNLIPEFLIDQLLAIYQSKILASKDYFFRQSSNRWETNKTSSYGYAEESFLNVHDYPNYPEFTEITRQIFCSQPVKEALTQITGDEEHNLMQSMLFDLNTATHAHQDWYYLDSMPPGHLLAGWFALEDIHKEAGRFFVLPKSNWIDFDLTVDEKISTTPYRKKLQDYLDTHQDEIYAPVLNKGDVLFWNSRTIHGSLETINPQYSRKSLTAHYLPSQYPSGSRYATAPSKIDYENYQGMKYRLVPDVQKNFSYQAKLKTDLWEYIIDRPRLARVAKFVKDTLKKT